MWFNRKAKARENLIEAQKGTIKLFDEKVLELQIIIREMDQDLWAMSQCSSWPQMQPHFAALMIGVEQRKKEESNRIQALLIPEMRKAYHR